MMMRMLEAGGMPVLSDGTRGPDESNPRGYYELESVKRLHADANPSWLAAARGKAVKIVAPLLTWLPETHNYKVILMRRDLDEVIASQARMLQCSEDDDRARLRATLSRQEAETKRFIRARACFTLLEVDFHDALADPVREAQRVAAFVGRGVDPRAMAPAIDRSLYRSQVARAAGATAE